MLATATVANAYSYCSFFFLTGRAHMSMCNGIKRITHGVKPVPPQPWILMYTPDVLLQALFQCFLYIGKTE